MSPLHQFTCVALAGRGVLISGAPGTGKSSLALALIDRGAALVGDDGVALAAVAGRLRASPAPATRGLLELRNVGIIPLPVAGDVPVALLLRLCDAAPRFVEAPPQGTTPRETIAGVAIPVITLWPGSPVLALRAEWALRLHGLG